MSNTEQLTNAGFKYVNGLQLSWGSNTTLSVAAGTCRDSTNNYDLSLDTAKTINAAVNGLNGLDTGDFAASKVYAVYVISDPAGFEPTGCLLSLSATAPYLPYGYSAWRRIGWAVSDSSTHFLTFLQKGNDSEREYQYDVGFAVLTGGSSTTFANVDCSAIVPTVSPIKVKFSYAYTPAAAANKAYFRQPGSSATDGLFNIKSNVNAVEVDGVIELVTTTTTISIVKPAIQYKVTTSDALTLNVIGYYDSL